MQKLRETDRMLAIKRTQIQMVRDRGYDITPEMHLLTINVDAFDAYITEMAAKTNGSRRAALSRLYVSATNPDRRMLVYYGGRTSPQQKQVSAPVVREFITLVLRYRASEAVLVVDAQISATGNDELKNFTQPPVQVFHDTDLAYNPTTHVDTPRHELVPPEEEEALLRSMKTDRSKMLLIKESDPIVRYYGWRAKGIIRIHRDDRAVSVLSPKTINYRFIIN
jgi:DNA-directed RNA polymerase subunit H (RpoH/RPB5)